MTPRIVYIDTETGGTNPDRHPLIQWAGVAIEDGKELEAFEVKLQFPLSACEVEALQLNSYDRDTWEKEAVSPKVAVERINDFLVRHATVEQTSKRTGKPYSVARVAGYNVRFDQDFTRAAFGTRFLPAHPQALDVMQLAAWAFLDAPHRPANLKLQTVAVFLGLTSEGAHDALADARLAWRVVETMKARAKEQVEEAVRAVAS